VINGCCFFGLQTADASVEAPRIKVKFDSGLKKSSFVNGEQLWPSERVMENKRENNNRTLVRIPARATFLFLKIKFTMQALLPAIQCSPSYTHTVKTQHL
jgi:hypothetical protein